MNIQKIAALRKIALYGSAALGGVFILVGGVLTVANWGDQPLNPEVEKILSSRPSVTEADERAFQYFLGLYFGHPAESAEAEGRALWESVKKGGKLPKVRKNSFNAFTAGVGDIRECDRKGFCTVEDLIAHPQLAELIEKHSAELDRLRKMASYRGGANLFAAQRSWWEFPFSPATHLYQSRLLRVQSVSWAKMMKEGRTEEVFREMEDLNRFYSASAIGGTYLEGILGVLILNRNADILAAEKKRRPGLKLPPSLLRSFDLPAGEELLTGLKNTETRIFADSVDQFRRRPGVAVEEMFSMERKFWHDWLPANGLLRRGQTLNEYYKLTHTMEISPEERPRHTIRNPVGNGLIQIFAYNLIGREKKMIQKLGELKAKLDGLQAEKS